jgi:hypothetical protein
MDNACGTEAVYPIVPYPNYSVMNKAVVVLGHKILGWVVIWQKRTRAGLSSSRLDAAEES